jgi:2-keto-4-pentenoate hydratase/2-oxohepta-3-ene-1,7-dioic acid hydratase in catechol pathway
LAANPFNLKLALYNDYRPGAVDGDRIVDLSPLLPGWTAGDPGFAPKLCGAFSALRPAVEALIVTSQGEMLADITLRAPIPLPGQVLAAPLNFRAHRDEMSGSLTAGPGTARELGFFVKASRSVTDPAGPVGIPDLPGRRFDFEAEVAVIIGRTARAVAVIDALDYILGYSLLLDMTLRMTDNDREERTLRKSYEGFTPFGPWIVSADEISDPSAVTIKAWRNGELRQDATLTDLIVSVPEMVSRASNVVTLEPGDVIAMGSPAGVGEVRPGDLITVEAPRIGSLAVGIERRTW